MKVGHELPSAGTFNLKNAIEHFVIASTGIPGSELFEIHQKIMGSPSSIRRDARRLALIPLLLIPHMNAIPTQLYTQVNNDRTDTYLLGALTPFNLQITPDGKFVEQRMWLPQLSDPRTGEVENRYEVEVFSSNPDGTYNSLPDSYLDQLLVNIQVGDLFTLHPRQAGENFRVLEVKIS